MDSIFVPWLVEVGIISVRDLTGPRRLPLPSELLATFVVFGGLGLVGGPSSTWKGAATTTAWGIVVATLLSSKVDFLKPVGDFFAGSSGPAPVPFKAPVAGQDTGNILRSVG